MGFLPALTLALIILKLTNYIAWSWLWVFTPLLLGVFIFFAFITLLGILGATSGTDIRRRRV